MTPRVVTNPRAIAADAVPQVFDDACIRELALLARLPLDANLSCFGEAVRWAVRTYIAQAAEPTPNTIRREIEALHSAAKRRQYDVLAALIEQMTQATRQTIEARRGEIAHVIASRPKRRASHERILDWRIPDPAELCDPARQENAADELLALIEVGARFKDRNRPSGRPTVNLAPILDAPKPSRAEPRREAERALVMWLQAAVAEAGGRAVQTARTADCTRNTSPFASMVAEVLQRSGAGGPARGAKGRAVRFINDLHKSRRAIILDVIAALAVIPYDGPADRKQWNRVGMAVWCTSSGSVQGFNAWAAWSGQHPEHGDAECRERWDHYPSLPPDRTRPSELFAMARLARPDWERPSETKAKKKAPPAR